MLLQKPYLFYGIKYAFSAMLFTTPYIASSVLFSLLYIFSVRQEGKIGLKRLPPYPESALRSKLYVVVGEIHHQKRPEAARHPRWLIIPERGLLTGIAVFGAAAPPLISSLWCEPSASMTHLSNDLVLLAW